MNEVFENVDSSYADQSRKIIKRFLHSYESDEPDKDHMKRVVERLPPHRAYTSTDRYSYWDKSIPFSHWNQKETKDNVELALDFLLRNSKCIKYHYEIEWKCIDTLYFFVCNEFYDSLIDEYVQFLSETFDDDSLTNIFIGAFKIGLLYKNNDETNSPDNLFDERLRQFLIMLQKLERLQVLKSLSRKVLIVAPNTFEKFYIVPFEDAASDNLLSPNSLGLTRFHISAFKTGNTNIIQGFIINECRKDVLVNILLDEDFSPLYVAAARGNKDAFHVMLSFLKEESTTEQLLQDFTCNRLGRFLFRALVFAIEYESIEMFQLILCGVKKVLGQNGLLALLGPLNREKTDVVGSNDSVKISKVLINVCCKKEFMRTMAEILDNGYNKLNELLFKIDYEDDIFSHLRCHMVSTFGEENVKGMIQAEGGFSSWLKLIFDSTCLRADVSCLMDESSLNFLRKYGLVSEFVQFILSSREAEEEEEIEEQEGEEKRVKMSYWAEWFSSYSVCENYLDKFFKCVSEDEYGQERLKELLSHDQCKLIFNILIENPKEIFEVMLKYLTDNNRKEVTEQIFNYLLLTTETLPSDFYYVESVVTLKTKTLPFTDLRWEVFNVIWFLSEYNFESHTFDDICRILLSNRDCDDGKKRSIWSLSVDALIDRVKLDELDGFLKWATERLGKDESTTSQKIKELILHDDGSGVVIFQAAQGEEHEVVDILLKYLNEEDRKEIEQLLINESTKTKMEWLKNLRLSRLF